MGKKVLFVGLFFVLLAATVAAEVDFSVSADPLDNVITLEQKAKFRITITNSAASPEEFRIKTMDYPLWEVLTDPISNPITIAIPPFGSRSLDILIGPLQLKSLGVYDVNLLVQKEGSEDSVSSTLRVNIVSPEAGDYVETVLATIVMDDEVNPSRPIPVKVKLNNQNSIEYREVLVRIESSMFSQEQEIILGKREKKTVEFEVALPPITPPGSDTIVATVLLRDKTLDREFKRFGIVKYQKLESSSSLSQKLLKKTQEITYTNIGNVPFEGTVKVSQNFVQSLFTTSNPKGYVAVEDGKRFLSLKVSIPPGGAFVWVVSQNYLALLVIAALVIIGAGLYFVMRAPVALRKAGSNVVMREGGVAELKVIIHIKNRGKIRLQDIHVVDRVPDIAELERGMAIGTLHPVKVLRHEKKGTIIKWVVEHLDPGEDRVISYKVKTHLPIVGGFSLPPFVVAYSMGGTQKAIYSNALNVSPGKEGR
ncbi:hypothetical protein HYV84_07440 [Candidatus Woesearchaeota archaeon]|nr:hypothetical protein [Candidatus Woesearchaeota archaeon]